jgi:PAS domain S-box-containing protein
MVTPLHVLILSDDPADARSMVHELRRAGFDPDWQRVDTEADYLACLDPALDVVLADYALPDGGAPRALHALQERGLPVPFIMIGDSAGQDVAVECIKQGAADFLLRDHLARLGPTVVRALEDRRLREAKESAEAALREGQAQYRLITGNMHDVVWLMDMDLKTTWVSPSVERSRGYTPEEFMALPMDRQFSPGSARRIMEAHVRDLAPNLAQKDAKVSVTLEVEFYRKDGSPGWAETTFTVLRDAAGDPSGILVSGHDITERKRAEEVLRNSEAFLDSIIEHSPHAMWISDSQGTLIRLNQACRDLLRITEGEVVGKYNVLEDTIVAEQGYMPLVRRVFEQREIARFTLEYDSARLETLELKEHVSAVLDVTISPVLDANGRVIHAIVQHVDITERQRAEQALAEERNLLRTLPDLIYAKDTQGRFTLKNRVDAARMGAASPEETIGKTDFDYYPLELAQRFHADDQAVIQSGQPLINREEPITGADGSQGLFLTSKVPLRDGHGNVIGLVGVGRDITERKRAEAAERDARVLAEALAETASALTRALDLDTVVNTILENVAQVVPHDAANIVLIEGDRARVVHQRGYPPEHSGVLQESPVSLAETRHLQQMLVTRAPFLAAYTDQHPDWVRQPYTEWVKSTVAAPIQSRGNVIGFLNLDSATPGFFTGDHARRLQSFADQASVAIENAQLYEEIRRHAAELERRVRERTAQLNHAKERVEAILNGSNDMMILCRADGVIEQVNPIFDKTFHYEADEVHFQPLVILVTPEHTATLEQSFAAVIETQQPQRLEVTACGKERETFDVDVVLSPIVEQNGHLLGIICSLRDITSRKQMEARLRQMLSHEMELSELKSRYVSMAAHDLRNPLSVIQSAVNMIGQYGDRMTGEQIQAKYDHIGTNIQVMVDMLDDILTVGQVESGRLTLTSAPLDVVAFCRNIIAEIKHASGTEQVIDFRSQGDCATAYLDAKLLRHILANLLSNAVKYSPETSPVTFSVDCQPDQIIFCIQDRGIGIPADDQAQLFETFHRGRNAKRLPGTGLGLAIVKQSVELHAGTISFESEEGVGTTFTVTIPVAPPEDC